MVYDLTACGLNDTLWVPTFWMPIVNNVLDYVIALSWFEDADAGEFF